MKLVLVLLLHVAAATEQCCGPGQSQGGFGHADQSPDAIPRAVQSELSMAEASSNLWLRSPAVPLRHKALIEPCTLGKVHVNN